MSTNANEQSNGFLSNTALNSANKEANTRGYDQHETPNTDGLTTFCSDACKDPLFSEPKPRDTFVWLVSVKLIWG